MNNIEEIKNLINLKMDKVNNIQELNDLKVEFLGKKGLITEANSAIKNIPNEEKKEYGMKVNEVRTLFNTLYEEKLNNFKQELLSEKLASEKIDISMPAVSIKVGSANILEKLVEEVEEVFMSMGYDVVDGPEIEEDHYNFEDRKSVV